MTDIRALELRVVQEAMKAQNALGGIFDKSELANAIKELTFACNECNYGGHTCPGDGNSIPHGASSCGEHDETPAPVISNERRRLADYLSGIAQGTVEEWMRIVEVEEDTLSPGSGISQVCIRWAGDGTFVVGETQYGDELGQYRLAVRVEALPDLPPIGPENDPAQRYDMRDPRIGRAGFCIECTDEDEDPRAWCDCGGNTELYGACLPPCCSRAHAPENCPARAEWVASTFLHIEKGDRLRIGEDEATVLAVSKLNFHADNTDPYRPKPWEHVELRADVGFGMTNFPTGTPVEIWCDAERKAQLIMSEAGLKPRRIEGSDQDA